MAKYTITISDSVEANFINYLKNLSGVKKVEKLDESLVAPAWHEEVISLRLKEYLENPSDVVDFENTLNQLEKDI